MILDILRRATVFQVIVFLSLDTGSQPSNSGIQKLTHTIAGLTTDVALLAIVMAALSYMIGTILRGAPIPYRELKSYGDGLIIDSIKTIFLVAAYSAIASLVVWLAVLLSSS